MLSVRRCAALTVALVVVLAAGCSRQPPPLQALPAPSVTRDFVPDLVGMRYDEADAALQAQLLVPIMRFAPELITNAGTVVSLEPAAGSVAKTGDVIVVIVAGKPPKGNAESPPGARAIAELAQLEQQLIVGVGSDRDSTIVVSFAPGTDLELWQARIAALARGERFRLQSCRYSGAELRGLMAQLAERDFLPRAKQMQVSIVADPVSCSVQLAGAFTPAEVTQLQERYGDALTVLTGKASRT
jgi:PASTA domain-containing protein